MSTTRRLRGYLCQALTRFHQPPHVDQLIDAPHHPHHELQGLFAAQHRLKGRSHGIEHLLNLRQ